MTDPVLIVGAGPYGLGLAQELWERGVEPRVVGLPFEMWHRHTLDAMELRSDSRTSEIHSPSGRYSFPRFLERHTGPEEIPERQAPIGLFREYLREVEAALPFEVARTRVVHLERQEDGFRARTEQGDELEARFVVVAAGLGAHRYLPPELARLPREHVVHSWDAERIDDTRDRRVLVVGGGQSAAEAVATLRAGNRVTWAMRRPPLFFREPLRVPTPLFKAVLAATGGLFRLPPPALRLVATLCFRTTITPNLRPVYQAADVHRAITDAAGLELEAGGAGVASGHTGESYHLVVGATGFRHSTGGLSFLSADLMAALGDAAQAPELSAEFESAVPGLHMIGGISEGTFGPIMRFILGASHTARRLGAVLEKRLAARAAA